MPKNITPSLVIFLSLFFAFFSAPVNAYEAGYYAVQTPSQLPSNPNSMVMRATQVDVPAGAIFSLHLMKAGAVIATSRTIFSTEYKNLTIFTGTAIASFRPTGTTEAPGDNFPGAKLYTGTADLNDVATNPGNYSFFYELSDGHIAPKNQLLTTSPTIVFSFVDLKLNAVAAAARQSDQKPGSALFYQRYTSGFSRQGNNTTLSVTNTSPVDSAKVRMFFISGSDCQAFDQFICLAPQQTASFVMSDIDPGTTGYCIAVACDADGKPTQFNWLIGNAQIRQSSLINNQPYDASLSAIAVAKRSTGAVTVANNKGEMIFDDINYDRLPAQLAADNVPNQTASGANANATVLSVFRPTADLSGVTLNPRVDVAAFNNNAATATGFQSIGCYSDLRVANLRLTTPINTLIAVGRTGWIKLSANDSGALIGAQFNSGSYASGTPLRALTYASTYSILVPIKVPTC